MTTRQPARTRMLQMLHLLLAAVAAVVIAVALQGWPSPAVSCDPAAACDAG